MESRVVYLASLTAVAIPLSGCSDLGPGAAPIEITISTSGTDLDPDGYLLIIDDSEGSHVPPHSVRVPINYFTTIWPNGIGTRVYLELAEVAGNCGVTGENPRAITLREWSRSLKERRTGDAESTTFNEVCAAL